MMSEIHSWTRESDGHVFVRGQKVSVECEWPNGRRSYLAGTLMLIRDGEAYVDTSLGDVVGPLDTLEDAS